MGLRDKLIDFKRRLSDRKMYSIVILVIGAIGIWGLYQYKEASQLRQKLDNQYNRAFYDMVGYVQNVNTLLGKSLLTSTPAKTASILQEAWRQANMAQENLGQLPVATNVLSGTSKFLTQVGDLAYSLNKQNMQGKYLSDKQYKIIENLYKYALKLSDKLNDLQNNLSSGRLKWGELDRKGTRLFRKTSADLALKQFEAVDKTFQKYPTLIYDGPFSDHMTRTTPVGLNGEMITYQQGKEKVAEFFGKNRISKVEYLQSNNTAPIKTHSYRVFFKNKPEDEFATIDITQKGGIVYMMLYNRPVSTEKLSVEKAKEAGRKFLNDRGFPDMVDTYYLKEDNTAIINYAYKQGNVVIYPDLIKLKIALDTGEVLGFEGKAYLSSHRKREIPKARITESEARRMINSRVKIMSSGMAIIPTDFKTELYTYEFKGKLNDTDFIVYINAVTGQEEDILMIVDTPSGILTM